MIPLVPLVMAYLLCPYQGEIRTKKYNDGLIHHGSRNGPDGLARTVFIAHPRFHAHQETDYPKWIEPTQKQLHRLLKKHRFLQVESLQRFQPEDARHFHR